MTLPNPNGQPPAPPQTNPNALPDPAIGSANAAVAAPIVPATSISAPVEPVPTVPDALPFLALGVDKYGLPYYGTG